MHFQIALSDRWVSFLEQFQLSYIMLQISLLSIFFCKFIIFSFNFLYFTREFWRDSWSFLEIRDSSVLDKIITLSRNRGSKINKGKMFLKKNVKKIWEKKVTTLFFSISLLFPHQIPNRSTWENCFDFCYFSISFFTIFKYTLRLCLELGLRSGKEWKTIEKK